MLAGLQWGGMEEGGGRKKGELRCIPSWIDSKLPINLTGVRMRMKEHHEQVSQLPQRYLGDVALIPHRNASLPTLLGEHSKESQMSVIPTESTTIETDGKS